MSIQTEIKAWLDDLGFPYKFSEFEEMCREVELIGAWEMIKEYNVGCHQADDGGKLRLRKTIFAIYWLSEWRDDDPDAALIFLAEAMSGFFEVWEARENYGFTYKNIYEFVHLASWLTNQHGASLSYDSSDGYLYVDKIANFAGSHGENLNDGVLVSKKIRNSGCSCIFDSYGDENTTLVFIGGLLTAPSKGKRNLPSLDHLVEELRLSSKNGLAGLNPESLIYNKIRAGAVPGVDIWETAFDLACWRNNKEALKLFEDAVNQILREENDKLGFRNLKLDQFRVLDLHEFEADLEQ